MLRIGCVREKFVHKCNCASVRVSAVIDLHSQALCDIIKKPYKIFLLVSAA